MLGHLRGLLSKLDVAVDFEPDTHREAVDVTFEEGAGPLGMRLQRHQLHSLIYVHSWDQMPGGRQGPAEASGKVQIGDVLTHINGEPISGADFDGSIAMLKAAAWPLTLRFIGLRHRARRGQAARPREPSFGDTPETLAAAAGGADGSFAGATPGGTFVMETAEGWSRICGKNKAVAAGAAALDRTLRATTDAVNTQAAGLRQLEGALQGLPSLQAELAQLRADVGHACARVAEVEAYIRARELAAVEEAQREWEAQQEDVLAQLERDKERELDAQRARMSASILLASSLPASPAPATSAVAAPPADPVAPPPPPPEPEAAGDELADDDGEEFLL